MRRPGLALTVALVVQALAALAMVTPSVLAPVVGPQVGIASERVGLFVGLAYGCAMFSGLMVGPLLARSGPVFLSGLAVGLCGLGLLIGASALVPLFLLSAILIGFAYGIPNPTAALLLGVHAPPDRRGLFFSIKQAGVPVGVGSAGVIVPAMLVWLSWELTLLILGLAGIVLSLAARLASVLDRGRAMPQGSPLRPASAAPGSAAEKARALFGPLVEVMKEPSLRRLSLASICLATSQLCFITFVVSYLKLQNGLSLAAAAGLLSASQMVSIGARVFWGQVSDRWVAPGKLLGLLGLGTGVFLILLGLLPAGAPAWLALLVCAGTAATGMSWNGVYYAELAQRVAASRIAAVTGATQFMTFAGAMIGPVIFGAIVSATGSYGGVYVGFAAAPLAIGVWLLAASRGQPWTPAPPMPS